jgi:hypothetical protein
MKVFECQQGSTEWHQARAGVITASMFKVARSRVGVLDERQQKYVSLILKGEPETSARIRAGYKNKPTSELIDRALAGEVVGDWAEGSKTYAFRLAVERISGEALQDDRFETYSMRRGHELEPEARKAHEALGVMVRRAGFVTTDDGRFGASVDGLMHPDGASEYKCLVSPDVLRSVLLANDLSEFTDQMQGGLLVCGLRLFHYGLYCPALKSIGQEFTLRVIPRDEAYIEALQRDLEAFDELVCNYEQQLRAGVAVNDEHIALALAAAV